MHEAQIEAYVCQSQLIEGIGYTSNLALTRAHHEAVHYVLNCIEKGIFPPIEDVHMLLMQPTLQHWAGVVRRCSVYVGSRRGVKGRRYMPRPELLPSMLQDWRSAALAVLCHKRKHFLSEADLKNVAFGHYFQIECIHPFIDGNGRVGRLMCNALRGLLGLPWFTFTTDIHPLFVRELRLYEQTVFRKRYPSSSYQKKKPGA